MVKMIAILLKMMILEKL